MHELDLYKFCQDKEMDWRGDKLILWLNFWDINDFAELLGYNWLSENGQDVVLLHDGIAVELNDICENHDIEPERIHSKETK